MVGTSGIIGERFSVVTAMALMRPLFNAAAAAGMASKLRGIWPPIKSVMAGALPL
ncbi:hypothetical protein D3C77_816890 [compost metagenome]